MWTGSPSLRSIATACGEPGAPGGLRAPGAAITSRGSPAINRQLFASATEEEDEQFT
jgi:hypothetical protein